MKSKILFVNQPVTLEQRYAALSRLGNNTPPLTLCHMAGITRKHGFPTAILDAATRQMSLQETVARAVEIRPKYLGLYATTVTIDEAGALAKALKEQLPELVVLIGGIHFTYLPEETMEDNPTFDIGVIGEGDIAIVEILESLERGDDLSSIKGLIYRSDGKLVKTGQGDRVHDLNTLPMPAFDLLQGFPEMYTPPFFGFSILPIATAVVSRGCPAQCKFCRAGIFGDKNLRQYSPKYIVELMRYLEERFGVVQLLFYDDDFVMFKKHTKELCERIIKAGLKTTWSCNTRVIDVNPEILQLMKRAGCWQISFGIESGSQRVLNFMKKGATLEIIQKAIRWTKEAGIRTNGYFLFGFPTETEEEIKATIAFSRSLDLDIFQCTLFTPFPNLPFSKEVDAYGTLQTDKWADMNIFNPVFVNKGLTPELLEKYKKKAMRQFYFRPHIQLLMLRMILSSPIMLKFYLMAAFEFVRFTVFSRLRENSIISSLRERSP